MLFGTLVTFWVFALALIGAFFACLVEVLRATR
jgi:hypothetical protein